MLHKYVLLGQSISGEHTGLQIVLFALLCILACRLRWLTISGAVAAFITAFILAYGGWTMFSIPMILLVGGTILSKFNKESKEQNGRNALQVIANGMVGLCCLILYYFNTDCSCGRIFFTAFLISFNVSVCDTFSSEIGKYFNGKTIDILKWQPVAKGLSGGISIQGTLGGLAGLIICAVMSYHIYDISLLSVIYIGLWGFAGMLLDSVIGSKFQAKYLNEANEIEEHKSTENTFVAGYAWCTNDTVNILSNAIVVALFLIVRLTGLM